VEITPPPEEKPAHEDSPAIKEKAAEIDKLISEMNSSTDEKKQDELLKHVEELRKMREAERANDVNK
jgi:L-lactate utilization protein LutB